MFYCTESTSSIPHGMLYIRGNDYRPGGFKTHFKTCFPENPTVNNKALSLLPHAKFISDLTFHPLNSYIIGLVVSRGLRRCPVPLHGPLAAPRGSQWAVLPSPRFGGSQPRFAVVSGRTGGPRFAVSGDHGSGGGGRSRSVVGTGWWAVTVSGRNVE